MREKMISWDAFTKDGEGLIWAYKHRFHLLIINVSNGIK